MIPTFRLRSVFIISYCGVENKWEILKLSGKSCASGATTKTEVSDARLIAAFDAATLRWLEGLNRLYLISLLLPLDRPSPRIVAASLPPVASDTSDTKPLRDTKTSAIALYTK